MLPAPPRPNPRQWECWQARWPAAWVNNGRPNGRNHPPYPPQKCFGKKTALDCPAEFDYKARACLSLRLVD